MAKVAKAETQSWPYVGRDDFDLSLTTYKHSHSWSHSDRINLENTAFFAFPNHSHFYSKMLPQNVRPLAKKYSYI